MASGLRRALLALALALTAAPPPGDPVVGTWKLNVAKSKFTPGPGWQSQTRTYRRTPEGISVTWSGVGASGETMQVSYVFPLTARTTPMWDRRTTTR